MSLNGKPLDPANTPFADSFATATLAFLFPDTTQSTISENWIYYRFEANTLELLGTTSVVAQQGMQDTVYSLMNEDPDELFSFSLSYGDSTGDEVAGVNIANVSGFPVVQDRSGTTKTVVDGYGTLTTPAGTFQNAVRVKRVETYQDNFMGSITTQHYERYDWFVPGEKYILMHMEEVTITPPFGAPSVDMVAYYRSGEPTTSTAIAPNLRAEWQCKAFPNPAYDQLTLALTLPQSAQASVSLLDLHGRTQYQETIRLWAGDNQHALSVRDLPAGYYLLQLNTRSGQATLPVQIR